MIRARHNITNIYAQYYYMYEMRVSPHQEPRRIKYTYKLIKSFIEIYTRTRSLLAVTHAAAAL